jgi:hypothetical protein
VGRTARYQSGRLASAKAVQTKFLSALPQTIQLPAMGHIE